jgi:hypothetical protein
MDVLKRPARWRLAACAALLVWMSGSSIAWALPAEYQVKALFLFNFTRFVEWPPSAFPEPGSPIIIGVLGADPFGDDLDEVVRGEKLDGRPLLIRRFRRVQDVGDCQVLFVSASEASRLPQILSALKGRSILTVGDSADFARNGGMIHLMNNKNRIQLRINLAATEAAGLTLSSNLLRPAEIIRAAKTASPGGSASIGTGGGLLRRRSLYGRQIQILLRLPVTFLGAAASDTQGRHRIKAKLGGDIVT